MSASVIAALVAAFSALAVSVFGLIRSIFSSKLAAESAVELAYLKSFLSDQQSVRLFLDDELRSTLGALDESIQFIQRIKDELELLYDSVPGSVSKREVRSAVNDCRRETFRIYKDQSPFLSGESITPAHKAKRLSRTIEIEICAICEDTEGGYLTLREDDKRKLRDYRETLTNHQNSLRDTRLRLITDRLMILGD